MEVTDEGDIFTSVEIEINTSCNRRCPHCPNSIFDRGLIRNEKLMPTELFHKIIDELAEIGFSGRISPHFYGEPLLDRRLVDFMKYVSKRLPGAKIKIFTNGDYLTFDRYMELVRAGVNEFIVTQHDQWMPSGIKELFSHFESLSSLPVPVQYLIFDHDTPLYNRGGLINIVTTYSLPNCALWNFRNVTIDNEGNVILCCSDYLSSIRFGNVKEKKLFDIWFDNRYKEIRKDLRTMNFHLSICKRCIENIDPAEMKKAFTKMKIDTLEVPSGETFLHDPVESGNLVEIPDTSEFWVEMIKSDKKEQTSEPILIIAGWAVDSSAGAPAAAIFITFDGGQEFRAYYPVSRPDVAVHFRNEGLRDSGFIAVIPSEKLPPGIRAFRLKIVTHDRTGFYHPPKRFFLHTDAR